MTKKQYLESYNEILNNCDSYLKKMLPTYSLDFRYVEWAKCELVSLGTYRESMRIFIKEV